MIAADKLEDCLDSALVFQYHFDTMWTRESIHALEALGPLRYYDSFAKPMFHLRCRDGTTVKGVQDTAACRVIFSRNDPAAAKKRFEEQLEEIFMVREEREDGANHA